MHIIFATASSGTLAEAAKAHTSIATAHPNIKLTLFLLEESLNTEQWHRFEQECKSANLFIYDPHGVENNVIMDMVEICSMWKCDQLSFMMNGAKWEQAVRFGALRGDDIRVVPKSGELILEETVKESDPETYLQKTQALESYKQIKQYWHASSLQNWKELIYFTANLYGEKGIPAAKPPVYKDKTGIIDPKTGIYYDNAALFLRESQADVSKPKIVFFYLASQARIKTADVIAELIERLQPTVTVIPVGLVSIMKVDLDHLNRLFAGVLEDIQLLVNFIGFRLGSGPGGEDREDVPNWLKQLNIPMLHPFFLTRSTLVEWEEAKGLSPVEAMVNVVLPELDGAVETYPIAAIQSAGFNEQYQFENKELVLIEERANYFINRVHRWLHLRQTKNEEKRIALIGYNYPPGEGNLFSGSFLDTFDSISAILDKLADEGYQVEPMAKEELEMQFRRQQLFNESNWGIDEELDKRIQYPILQAKADRSRNLAQDDMKHYWGSYPGEIMTNDTAFLIPGFVNGNVFIGLQPSRNGAGQDSAVSYHDQSVPPHYQYQAFYTWLEQGFRSDAVVHIGTHGTLEYLPGKENGMSASCFPDQLIQALPHFYLYYIGNPSEAMLAKRRTHAVLSSYQAPPFRDGGLHGDYEKLEQLLHEYREAEQLDPLRCETILKELQVIADSNGFSHHEIEAIEQELQRMQYALIPYGLHTIGKGMDHEDAIQHTLYTLRKEHQGSTLKQLVAQWRPALQGQEAALEKAAASLLETYLETKELPDTQESSLAQAFADILMYGESIYQRVRETEELPSIIQALNGGYLPAKLAGDIYRNPESLSTGSNVYQFDPRSVPSPSAVTRGTEIAEATIAQYEETHGKLLHTVACVLWGVETSRTQGETIGQILAYVGAKAVKRSEATSTTFELIPLSELGRPRINVAISMSGVFRDLFPNVIEALNDLFQKLALANEREEDNYFKAFTWKVQAQLLAEGYTEAEAFDLAASRIFGPASGEYGTGINHMIEDGNWEDEEELGEMYKHHAQYVYSKLKRGENIADLYDVHMKATDIVSQLRASHEYEITDLDDYYNFFGGLSKSIEKVKGERVDIYITDTTQQAPHTEDVKDAINRGVRTRLTNPTWIEGLLQHPYHGVQRMAKHTENLLGLAATTNKVENWVFSHVHSTYVEDKVLQEKIRQANPHAYHDLLETLVEVSERGYWEPSESEWQHLREAVLEAEASME
ncbi:cobaltochelatase subunit CobN [Gracilibacillus alcaliphilus]|uniref:cobaltochelatase subunit CobN n=1 Tax=Gracilibacillus alcaliphilus TaxID=1401441 RepID=UPI001959176E|nr:cobaltochelatase subunit CobN [Gracilibacillus alcaliphilus]MBM7678783.1 cobaltochelatase CobN [Gracilibacillus alcaliphilus]